MGACFDPNQGALQLIAPPEDPRAFANAFHLTAGTPILCHDARDCIPVQGVQCLIAQNLSVYQDLNCNGIDVFDDIRRTGFDDPEPFPNSRFAPPPRARFR